MIKAIFILCILWTASAFAVPIDPAPDHIGVYFDPAATITNFDSTPNVPFTAYVIITNPTGSDILGAELSYSLAVPAGYENSIIRTGNDRPFESVDVGDSDNRYQGEYIMGMANPLPHSSAVILVTWGLYLLDDFPVHIYLGPSTRQSIDDGFPAYLAGGSMVALGLPSGSTDIHVATVNGGVSGVPAHDGGHAVVLGQCRPNPFNPRTTIHYSLAREGSVTLLIHDVSGRAVRTLLDGEVNGPGAHEVIWDGLDTAGNEAASGVYFYRIEALGVSEAKRMTLVR